MQKITPLAREFSQLTRSSDKTIRETSQAVETSSQSLAKVIAFEPFTADRANPPAKYSSIGELVQKWEKDESRRETLEEGRRWIARSYFGEEGETVRSMRLSRGWSQNQLAKKLKTSQSHIARIERGTENLTIDTCRRLATALGIDLNSLNTALLRQEAFARARGK